MLKVEAVVPNPMTSAQAKRARKMIADMLERDGRTGRSASGQTLVFAVEWCEERRRPYRVTAYPGAGYFLELLEPLL